MKSFALALSLVLGLFLCDASAQRSAQIGLGYSPYSAGAGLQISFGSHSRRRERRAGFGCSVSRSSYAARRVYVPGRYQMCSVRVWVPGSVIQEWIPARYETRYDSCGLPQSYLVRAGFYTTRQNPGHYETRSERRWVAAHWNSR